MQLFRLFDLYVNPPSLQNKMFLIQSEKYKANLQTPYFSKNPNWKFFFIKDKVLENI